MNNGNAPVAIQPRNISTPSTTCGPWKYSTASGVSTPARQKVIMMGLRPMRSDRAGAPKPETADARPRPVIR